MKWIFALCALAGVSQAQNFYSSQAARLVIGQNPFTNAYPGASDKLLGSITGVAYAADTLIIADGNNIGGTPVNHRVLIYRNVSSFIPDRKAVLPLTDRRCPACVGKADVVLGQPDFTTTELKPAAQNTLRNPLGVAYNGRVLAVADTDNNRVLIWRSLPAVNQQPADLVVGQKDFTSSAPGLGEASLRGPTGLFLDDNNGLWVADTGNNRVLYFGEITQNGQAAKLVLGQPNLTTDQQVRRFPEYIAKADSMLAPSSVWVGAGKVIVADLGLSRVLIWNSIPTSNGQAASVVVGQPDFNFPEFKTGGTPTNTVLCESNGTDKDGKPTYPQRCAATLDMPRAVLSDGRRLFVADSGNDRVLIWNEIPAQNGQRADIVLGQLNFELNQSSDSGEPRRVASTDSFKTPTALAYDGLNLYVSDTYNRRVLVYTPGDFNLPVTAVRNAPSPATFARGSIVFSGTVEKDVELTIKIGNENVKDSDGKVITKDYKISTTVDDSFDTIIDRFVQAINGAPDPYVTAAPNKLFNALLLIAREADVAGNSVTLETAVSPEGSKIVMTTSGSKLTGGQDPALVAPFALVAVLGDNLADQTAAVADLTSPLPYELGGVQFFVDGLPCPIVAVSPERVIAQIPVEVAGSNSASGVLRVRRNSGEITVSSAVAVRLIEQNPSVYTLDSPSPSPGLTFHFSSQATGTISVDGAANPGDTPTVYIRDRKYTYRVQATDTLATIRDNLIALINAFDPEVEAFAAGPFQRIRLRARIEGPAGNGIPIKAQANTDAQVIMTALNSELCCANSAGAPVTEDNPAQPGETIVVLASGLGLVGPEAAKSAMKTGKPYDGPEINDPLEFVSSLVGGRTANVLFAGLKQGAVGVYEVHLELNPDLPTNLKTEGWIAQSFQISNIFTIPVVSRKPRQPQ
ncbi:MAG: hypothetical protein ACOYX1_16110 [Acidobacteriota bacterium]